MKNTKKTTETEVFVDDFIAKNGHAPTYAQIADHFGIAKGAAHNRCENFRVKLNPLSHSSITDRKQTLVNQNKKLHQVVAELVQTALKEEGMISFGEYLLSKERVHFLKDRHVLDRYEVGDRYSYVHNVDILNWRETRETKRLKNDTTRK